MCGVEFCQPKPYTLNPVWMRDACVSMKIAKEKIKHLDLGRVSK